MAGRARAAARRARDEPGPADERWARLRFGFSHPHARPGRVRATAGAALRSGVCEIWLSATRRCAAGHLALHTGACTVTASRVVLSHVLYGVASRYFPNHASERRRMST